MSLTRDQLRAARALLCLNQAELAELSQVGLITIRRYEGGQNVGDIYLEKLRIAIEAAGAFLIDPGTALGGATTGIGVALFADADLPEPTKRRLAANAPAKPRPEADPTMPKRAPGRPRKTPARAAGTPSAETKRTKPE